MAEAENNHTPTAAAWRSAIDKLSPEEREFLHRPLVEDVWLSAFGEFPDTKPLAKLLRSTPIPPAIADSLAEYLDPGDPDIYGGRLVYEPTDGIRRIVGSDGDAGSLSLVKDYHDETRRRKQAGEKDPSQVAAESVGKKTGQSGRTIYRKILAWRDLVPRLRERLRGR